jgi:hypothetical protein
VQPPKFLPPASSRAWHNPRWWDGLGYFRVRSLATEGYRDANLLLSHVKTVREMAAAAGDDQVRDLADKVIRLTRSWVRQPTDEVWQAAVHAVDAILSVQQHRRSEQRESG